MIQFPTNIRLLFICQSYFYSGFVQQADGERIVLHDAALVLDTGTMGDPHWNEAEYLGTWSLKLSNIESWGEYEKTVKPDEKRGAQRVPAAVIPDSSHAPKVPVRQEQPSAQPVVHSDVDAERWMEWVVKK